jgi:hypothetical protein
MLNDRRWRAALLVLPLAACATAGGGGAKPATPVDLGPARAAVEEARHAGAPERAAETFRDAEKHLKQAEALSTSGRLTTEGAQRAELLGKLAAAEARCAATLVKLDAKAGPGQKGARAQDSDIAGRLRQAQEERRRLEERVALLQRELELTETEVVRSKARLQGIETKAEASSAIAEARILVGRLDAHDRATLTRCQELLGKAEQQIGENNFGAAVFFARKAQEIANKARDPGPSLDPRP